MAGCPLAVYGVMGSEIPKTSRAAITTASAAQQVMSSKATMPIVRIVLSFSKKTLRKVLGAARLRL